jgi:HKD family nuclease
MPIISIQAPLNQPEGKFRLLERLRVNLLSQDFTHFFIITAFAKEGPLLKLKPEIDAWRAAGKSIEAIFGIDENGTSIEALQFAINNFNASYIAKIVGGARSTFHPKIYIFNGLSRSLAFIGSNNLTPGGLETNAESHVIFDLQLPADIAIHNEVMNCWQDTLRACVTLNAALLTSLVNDNRVISELQMRAQRVVTNRGSSTVVGTNSLFPRLRIIAPSPVPRNVAVTQVPTPIASTILRPASPVSPVNSVSPNTLLNSTNINALVLQIVPHHNGEIFLSKIALNQNPNFFGFPFTGNTVPKKSSNSSYPQRLPDPIVNLYIYDIADIVVYQSLNLSLNTVYYTTKADIRITITPSVAQTIQALSLLVMENSNTLGLDYELHIYPPGSPQYTNYIAACNQQMPSGGSGTGRRFGWI